jgi:PPOX class probable F420-dependent enzyme
MDAATAYRRLRDARVARLATASGEGRPHLVPCVFTLGGSAPEHPFGASPRPMPSAPGGAGPEHPLGPPSRSTPEGASPKGAPAAAQVPGPTLVTIYSAVDAKPKTSRSLRRLANLRANPAASLLVDHYDEDWTALWWVRVDGRGRVIDTGDERSRALALLAAKYPQYRAEPPPGPVIALDVTTWRAWP